MINWRKWNRIIHRDFGFLFFGMTIIYAISGIALNHKGDWNPNFIIERQPITIEQNLQQDSITKENVLSILKSQNLDKKYKQYYFPVENHLKIFFTGGTVEINLANKTGYIETLTKRPLLFELNFLHYNPKHLWTWFSDLFCVGLALIAITGLFIIKGKKGITGRGAWLTGVGVIIPFVLLLLYI